jgi:hypothetical protein
VLNGIVITTGVFNGVKFNKKKCNVAADTKLYIKRPCFPKIFRNRLGKNTECGTTKMRLSGTFLATNPSAPALDGAFPGYPSAGSANLNHGARSPKCEIQATVPMSIQYTYIPTAVVVAIFSPRAARLAAPPLPTPLARAFAPSPPTHSRATRIAPPAPSPSPGAAAPPFASRAAADAPRAAQPSPSAFAALVRAPARARAPSRRRRAPPRSSSSSSARRMARAAAAAAAAAAASAVRDAGAPGARAHGSRTVYAYVLILTVYAYDK